MADEVTDLRKLTQVPNIHVRAEAERDPLLRFAHRDPRMPARRGPKRAAMRQNAKLGDATARRFPFAPEGTTFDEFPGRRGSQFVTPVPSDPTLDSVARLLEPDGGR